MPSRGVAEQRVGEGEAVAARGRRRWRSTGCWDRSAGRGRDQEHLPGLKRRVPDVLRDRVAADTAASARSCTAASSQRRPSAARVHSCAQEPRAHGGAAPSRTSPTACSAERVGASVDFAGAAADHRSCAKALVRLSAGPTGWSPVLPSRPPSVRCVPQEGDVRRLAVGSPGVSTTAGAPAARTTAATSSGSIPGAPGRRDCRAGRARSRTRPVSRWRGSGRCGR